MSYALLLSSVVDLEFRGLEARLKKGGLMTSSHAVKPLQTF